MVKSQAILLVCNDLEASEGFNDFLDNNLNLYSYKEIRKSALIKLIMSEEAGREDLFDEISQTLSDFGAERMIIFGHIPCVSLTADQDLALHETFLRHAVSVLRAKFSDKQIEAYLGLSLTSPSEINFQKVI